MIRGTSQTFKFKSPYDINRIVQLKIVFEQYGNNGTSNVSIPIVKTIEDCTLNENSNEILVTLNQTETLAFTDDKKAYVQFRAVLDNGYVFGSKLMKITVYPTLDPTAVGDDPIPGDLGDTIYF